MKSKKIFNKIFYQEENKNTSKEFTPFDKENKIDKLSLIVVIVNKGQGVSIENILLKNKCSATFTFHGVGTASQETYLNTLVENKKSIVVGVIKDDEYENVKKSLEDRFAISKYAKGIAFKIPLSSVGGVSVYKYLSQFGYVARKEL